MVLRFFFRFLSLASLVSLSQCCPGIRFRFFVFFYGGGIAPSGRDWLMAARSVLGV